MDIFSPISSKTLPFDTHSMGVYGDPSFSSYLNGKEDHRDLIIRKLTESTRYLKSPHTIIPVSGGREDGEIGIFGAEKYFNGGIDDEKSSQRSTNTRNPTFNPSPQNLDHMDKAFKPKPSFGTPSVGSESSSVNSQRPLLKMAETTTKTTPKITNNNNSSYSYSLQKRSNNNNNNSSSKSFLSNTLSYCMCCSRNNKTAVEDVGEISFSNAVTTNLRLERETQSFKENHFTFPTSAGSLKVVHFQQADQEVAVERKSLEVFGSPVMGRLRNNKPISLEKRLAILSWDHTNNNNDNLGGVFYNEDEVNSDCSSDLFEIESLTKQTNPFHSPTTSCYAPSEASVDWSVVTASALDFEERRPSTTSPARVVAPPPPMRFNVNKEVVVVPKRQRSSLLGCKSEKAVRVAEDNKYGRNSAVAVKSFKDESETKVGGFSFRSQGPPPLLPLPPPHRALATRSLPQPYSPRLSNITFNIQ